MLRVLLPVMAEIRISGDRCVSCQHRQVGHTGLFCSLFTTTESIARLQTDQRCQKCLEAAPISSEVERKIEYARRYGRVPSITTTEDIAVAIKFYDKHFHLKET